MSLRPIYKAAAALVGWSAVLFAQASGQSVLALRVDPEARLSVSSVTLRFSVPGVTEVTVPVEAWARPLPHRHVQLTATPAGPLPPGGIVWRAAKTAARGGGTAASCDAGTARGAGRMALVSGWSRPGTLACSITFSLADAGRLAPGDYNVTLLLDIGI